jgi:hypothetical protein
MMLDDVLVESVGD